MWILLLSIIFLLDVEFKVETGFVHGPKLTMSKQSGEEECKKTGRTLVNYKDIKVNTTSPIYLDELLDGESAWIGGYAKLSPFLSWQGCFNVEKIRTVTSLYTVAIASKSLFLCSKDCQHYSSETKHIGVKDNSCYCITDAQRQKIQYESENDTLCSLPCENNALDSCGGHSYMSVYSIIAERSIHWATNEPSARQCVYVKKNGALFGVYTASCHSYQTLMIRGYICMNSASSRLETKTCTKEDTSHTYCIVEEASTRQKAYSECVSRGGILSDLSSESVILPWMGSNLKYWIGVYRTFEISEKQITNEICLAATKAGNILYLEPDDCKQPKSYLCKQNPNVHSSQYPSTLSNAILIITTLNTTGAVVTTTIVEPDTDKESPIVYIIPSMLILLFLVILIVFVAYRRHKKRTNQNTRISQDNYDAIYEVDNLKNDHTVSSVSSDPGQNGDSKCLIVQSKPDKPVRQTLKRRTQVTEYENYTLKVERKEIQEKKKKKGKLNQGDEYDKIDFKQPNNVTKEVYEVTNVYNHVIDTENDNYDTMKSTKSFHSVGRLDDSYSQMKDGLVMDDNSDIVKSGKAQGIYNAYTGINSITNKNMEQKDDSFDMDKQPRFVIVEDNDYCDDILDDNKEEELSHSEPITYTEIAEAKCMSDVRKETENSEKVDKGIEHETHSNSVAQELDINSAGQQSNTTCMHTSMSCNDIDYSKDAATEEEIPLTEVDNATHDTSLNYVDVDLANYVDVDLADTVAAEND